MSATSRNEAVHRVKLQSPAATDESWRVQHVADEPIQLQQYTSCASPSSPFCVPHALTFTANPNSTHASNNNAVVLPVWKV